MNKNERYGNGKIYKLVNNVDDEIYIGSTCLPLAKRKAYHKEKSRSYPNRKVYAHLQAIGWDEVDIILIESYPCDSKMELEKRERYYIDQLKPSLNSSIPTRTKQEYRIDNADKIREDKKKYRLENRDTILETKRKYREAHREELRLKALEYSRNNSEQIKARSKLYRENNREIINAKKTPKYYVYVVLKLIARIKPDMKEAKNI